MRLSVSATNMPSGVAIPIASPVFVKLPWARRSSAIRCAFTRTHTKRAGSAPCASTNSPDVAACSRWTTPPIAAMSTWKRKSGGR